MYVGQSMFKGQCMHTYVHVCTCMHVSVCVCMALPPFPFPIQAAAGQRLRGDGEAGLLQIEMEMNSALVPSLSNSLCTQWELNKYLMMVLNLGSQQLFPTLTRRAPWGRSGGERSWGSLVFLPDPLVTPHPAGAMGYFTHPALGV